MTAKRIATAGMGAAGRVLGPVREMAMTEKQALHILLIEDHEEIATMMLTILDMLGHGAVWGTTVADATRHAESGVFDVILTDYSLPDGTALDLLARLKTSGVQTPVVLLTAHDSNFLAPGMLAGFAGHLQKPVELDDLSAILQVASPPNVA